MPVSRQHVLHNALQLLLVALVGIAHPPDHPLKNAVLLELFGYLCERETVLPNFGDRLGSVNIPTTQFSVAIR
jgi:hypothetical protein